MKHVVILSTSAVFVFLILSGALTPPIQAGEHVRVCYDPACFRGVTAAAIRSEPTVEDLARKMEQVGCEARAYLGWVYDDIPLQEAPGSKLCKVRILEGRCKGEVVFVDYLWLRRY